MYIKSITLDGFKSYGKRTEIKGFDQEFNAITGLNGTGKSNVLDSICFVLGISNLTQVMLFNPTPRFVHALERESARWNSTCEFTEPNMIDNKNDFLN